MKTVQQNDTITISYTGKLDNGDVFKVQDQTDPMEVTIGASEVPPTLEAALIGMAVGDTRKVRVPPDEGYGPRQKDLLQTIDSKEFIDKIQPKSGMILSLKVDKDGEELQVPATVIEIKEGKVVVDYNHPLAGHHLTYDIKILDINRKSE